MSYIVTRPSWFLTLMVGVCVGAVSSGLIVVAIAIVLS
jgi:hypothetical protein